MVRLEGLEPVAGVSGEGPGEIHDTTEPIHEPRVIPPEGTNLRGGRTPRRVEARRGAKYYAVNPERLDAVATALLARGARARQHEG